jgi:hypothetical protein
MMPIRLSLPIIDGPHHPLARAAHDAVGSGLLIRGEHVMPIALQPMEELGRMEEEIRQRQNGVRVLRLLRELFFTDGKLASSLPRAGEFPLLTFALVAAVVVPALAVMLLPPAQSAPAPTLPVAVDDDAGTAALWAQQAQTYVRWLQGAHAAVQGHVVPMPETF